MCAGCVWCPFFEEPSLSECPKFLGTSPAQERAQAPECGPECGRKRRNAGASAEPTAAAQRVCFAALSCHASNACTSAGVGSTEWYSNDSTKSPVMHCLLRLRACATTSARQTCATAPLGAGPNPTAMAMSCLRPSSKISAPVSGHGRRLAGRGRSTRPMTRRRRSPGRLASPMSAPVSGRERWGAGRHASPISAPVSGRERRLAGRGHQLSNGRPQMRSPHR